MQRLRRKEANGSPRARRELGVVKHGAFQLHRIEDFRESIHRSFDGDPLLKFRDSQAIGCHATVIESSLPDDRAIMSDGNLPSWDLQRLPTDIHATSRNAVPLFQVMLIEEVFTSAQRRWIITKLTEAMVSIEGEKMHSVTWVVIKDVRSGEWGIGGKAVTTSDVRALAAGK